MLIERETTVVAALNRGDQPRDEIGDVVRGMEYQIERLADAARALDAEAIGEGERALEAAEALKALSAVLAEAEVVIMRISLGIDGPKRPPSLRVVSAALRGVPIRLTVQGVEGETSPGDLADAVEAFAGTYAADRPETERNVLGTAARILRSPVPETEAAEA